MSESRRLRHRFSNKGPDFVDACADLVVSVNNVPMWPDIDAGLAEVRRILAAGGQVLIAWHGGHDPRGHPRSESR